MARRGRAHLGFAGAVKQVESEGHSEESAEKIIGYGKAHASAKAKKANPRLLKHGGKRG